MGDVLSQNEIDNLLAALSTGELDVDEIKDNNEKKGKEYDFARPSKFSKEHLRTMEMIFEHYGRLLSTNLPVYLRKNVQVEVVNSEAVTYSEFSNALSNPVLLGIVNFAPLKEILFWKWHRIWGMRLLTVCSVAEEILWTRFVSSRKSNF